jgi:hypothetical protein
VLESPVNRLHELNGVSDHERDGRTDAESTSARTKPEHMPYM